MGIVVPTLNNSVFAVMLDELTTTLGDQGYQTMIANSGYSEEKEQALVNSFLAWSPAGIVLTGLHHSRGTIRSLVKAAVPVVEVGEYSQRGIDSVVGFSHYEVGRVVAKHFVNSGITRAACVLVALAADYRARERAAGFC
ncbi:MAG TPA: substrate-binding domain-containing protein, partial [Burkholderiales bacterium]|nr:substrate-binding domain-containing protein [Burkholderiales bacterium]